MDRKVWEPSMEYIQKHLQESNDNQIKKRAALHNLGCKVNAYETQVMSEQLEAGGYEIVPFSQTADVYVINTCTVTNIADRKSRQMLHRARKKNPNAVIVAAGCYVQSAQEEIQKDLSIDIVIGNNQKKNLLSLLQEFQEKKEHLAEITDMSRPIEYEFMEMQRAGEHTRAFVKIQDGCNQFCSYCIIPFVRGRIRSKDIHLIEREVRGLTAQGYKEIVLTGIHLSSYGREKLQGEADLLTVIQRLGAIPGLERIRLGSLEQGVITEEFLKQVKFIESFCPHFHLSLQSGSEAVLKRMNRHYTPSQFLDTCNRIRKFFPMAAITTDVITGFPGETQEEFEETKVFVRKVKFAQMHIFPFSVRRGTKAQDMPGQLSQSVKSGRAEELIEIGRQMELEYKKQFLHKEIEVLIEEKLLIGDKYYQIGYTKEYVKIALEEKKDYHNNIWTGIVTDFLNNEILLAEK